jgi:hypothetical protein
MSYWENSMGKLPFFIVFVLLMICLAARADTYDGFTLCTVSVSDQNELKILYDLRIDIVGRKGEIYKVLLNDDQLCVLREKGLKIDVLQAEMDEDRRLWREADDASRNLAATAYYTASTFNMTDPPAGSLMEHLLQLYNTHPDICRLYNLGATQDGAYDIIAMKVTKNPDINEPEPKIRIYANIHGDEKGGLMVACDALDTILAGYTANPQDASAKKLVDGSEMWFIPMGNPYGNAHNQRYNSRNVDLNRNFWGPAGSDEPPAWSEKETQIIRDLTETATADHTKKRFTTSLSFHGGEICFNSVWNYSYTAPGDEPIFWSSRTPGDGCSDLNDCLTLAPHGLAKAYQDGCTTSGFWYTEGADWYITKGDTNDWSYGQWADLDTTAEVTANKTPAASQIPVFTAEHRQAVINYMLKTFQGIHGVMTDQQTGTPLDGTVAVTATASGSVAVPYDYPAVFTDPVVGDFHRVLLPGTYTVNCIAPGYTTTTIPGVVVAADQPTAANCVMCRPGLVYNSSVINDSCNSVPGNGIADPGETITLQVVLSHSGTVAATGVTAVLTANSPGVTLLQDQASFNDIPAAGTSASIVPHFRFKIAPSVACGASLSFGLHITSAQGTWDSGFSLQVGTVVAGGQVTDFSENFSGVTPPALPAGWTYNHTGGGNDWRTSSAYYCGAAKGMYYPCKSGSAANAWAYTPGIALTAGTTYTLTFSQKVQSASLPEDFEVKCGTAAAPAGQTVTILSSANYNNTTCTSRAPAFTVPATGIYYIGFHCTSDSTSYNLIMDNIPLAHISPPACTSNPCTEILTNPVVEVIESTVSPTGFSWSATDAGSYRVVRGLQENLANLDNSSADFFCYKWGSDASLSVDISADDPSSVAGRCYYYLTQGYSGTDPDLYLGPAGSSTAGARQVNTQSDCL